MELLTVFTFDMSVTTFVQCSLYYDSTEFIEKCRELPLPEQWMQNLDKITYGNRIDLSEINSENFVTLPLETLYPECNISQQKACEVIRFSSMVVTELNKLYQRDEKYLVYEPEPEEIKAGVKKLNHGMFGIIDSIARRCPQYSHDEILQLNQAVVFQMLKIDIDNANYAKRLRTILNPKK